MISLNLFYCAMIGAITISLFNLNLSIVLNDQTFVHLIDFQFFYRYSYIHINYVILYFYDIT